MTDPSHNNGHDYGHDKRREKPDCDGHRDHWLVRPATIRKLWWIFGAILAATVVAQFFIHVHGYFNVDEWPGFNALYGFLTCVGMVVFAKLLGFALKRPDDYYKIEPRLSPDIDDYGDKRGDNGHDDGHDNRHDNRGENIANDRENRDA
jgi:hypothetical protein